MDPARWARLEQICFDAYERPAPERAAFLTAACAGDPDLLAEATALLERLDRDPDFLERPVGDVKQLTGDPETIGPYRLVRVLGRGGMGSVYLAERQTEDFRRAVALKLIRRGMDTDEVLGRFRLERRILAGLHHPNIAALLDAAATEDGRPYFVMEYIDGTPLTSYCDQRQLDVRARLRLFLTICAAVEHAHQNLVVHRDLKPRNILVTAEGVPKLLDFGIGKVLGDSEEFGPQIETRTDVRLLTPEYASPEQVAGRPVTTATDVYGLGLLLYELLTGRHPYLSGGERLPEIEQAVLDSAPMRPTLAAASPSGSRRKIPADLEIILLKALRKEPERRYPSAAALADDVRRHLDGLPVSARPDTLGYRLGKFVRRNVAAVGVGLSVVLGLVATTVVSTVQSRRVAAEAARVRRERDKALEVRGFLLELFGASGADQAVRDTVTARQLLDLQAARVEGAYPDRPDVKADMMEVLAEGYDRLGLYDQADDFARRSLAVRRDSLGPDHPDVAASLGLLGWITHERGRSAAAESLLVQAIALRRAAGEAGRPGLGRALNDLGVVYNALNRYPAAESTLTESLAIRRELGDADSRAVGITANNLAAALYFQGRVADAIPIQQLAVQSLQASLGPDHQRTVVALGNLAVFNQVNGNWAGAEPVYRELLERQTRLQGRDHPVTARVMMSLATAIGERGGDTDSLLAEREGLLNEAVTAFERRLGPEHPQVGVALDQRANVRLERGDLAGALADAERARALIVARLGTGHSNAAGVLQTLALIRWRERRFDEALALQQQALSTFDQALGPEHVRTAQASGVLCDLELARGDDPSVATGHCARAVHGLSGARGFANTLEFYRLKQVIGLRRMGRAATADSVLREVGAAVGETGTGPAVRRLYDSLSTARP